MELLVSPLKKAAKTFLQLFSFEPNSTPLLGFFEVKNTHLLALTQELHKVSDIGW